MQESQRGSCAHNLDFQLTDQISKKILARPNKTVRACSFMEARRDWREETLTSAPYIFDSEQSEEASMSK